MKITWTTDHPDAEFSSRTGVDEERNVFHENAAREVVSVKLKDGREGQGWTADEAMRAAQAKPSPAATSMEFFAWADKAVYIAEHELEHKASIQYRPYHEFRTAFEQGQTPEAFALVASAKVYSNRFCF